MEHGEIYAICLRNRTSKRANASVYIDEKHAGTWRLGPYQTVRIERPVNDEGHFTFYLEGSDESRRSGISFGVSQNGLVRVEFVPEKVPVAYEAMRSRGVKKGASDDNVSNGFCRGATGISGHSGQRFTTVGAMDLDEEEKVVINLRLVGDSARPPIRPLYDVSECRSNAVPPPVTQTFYA